MLVYVIYIYIYMYVLIFSLLLKATNLHCDLKAQGAKHYR